MFKPSRGPKEGRSPPGLLYSGPAKSRFTQRQVAITLVVAVLVLLGYVMTSDNTATPTNVVPTLTKPGTAGLGEAIKSDANGGAAPAGGVNVPELNAALPSQPKSAGKPVAADSARFESGYGNPSRPNGQAANDKSGYGAPLKDSDFRTTKPPMNELYPEPHHAPSAEQIRKEKAEAGLDEDGNPLKSYDTRGRTTTGSTRGGKHAAANDPAPAREKWSERPTFEKALQNVIAMLPDEVHMRELIRPVEGTGKERMREMGLRTRAYRKYFDAWEALHLTTDDEGATYVRDDVVQYLRNHQHIDEEIFQDGSGIALSQAQTIRSYEAYRSFMNRFANLLFPWTAPYFSDHMSLHAHFKKGGRGIVLTAGDDQAPYLLTTIYSFRQLGCTLPIEVMYLGDQDLGEDYRAELEALPGVVTRDIAQMTNDEGWKLAGWAAKPFAMLLSSFREVIFIDADSLFFRNPEILFDDPGYQETGALFFRDRLIMPENKKRWLQQVLPKPIPKLAKQSRFWTGESGHMQESGVVVVDKWKHFISMLLVTRFNGPDRDGNKDKGKVGVYDMVYGDKETFWIGFLLAGDEKYHFHAGDAGIMGELETKESQEKKKEEKKEKNKKREEPAEEKKEAEEEEKRDEQAKSEERKDESTKEEVKTEDKKEGEEKKKEEDKKPEEAKKDTAPPPPAQKAFALDTEDDYSTPDNYTICAPQLLHLDIHGKPLWFNGWLLHNKFADKRKKAFAKFQHYLIEPRDIREPGAWQLAESNMCCLTTDHDKMFTFSREEKATLQMIMDRAQAMGMGDQS